MLIIKRLPIFACCLACFLTTALAEEQADSRLIVIENEVEVSLDNGRWQTGNIDQTMQYGDRVRTGDFSRAAVKLPSGSVLRIDELSEVRLQKPQNAQRNPGLDLKQGALYFFGRDQGEENELVTPTANGAIRGTEFIARAASNGISTIVLLEGSVEISNEQGSVTLVPGEQAEVVAGQAPRKTALVDASRDIQWLLYYPAVIDPLVFEQTGLARKDVLSAYKNGNLPQALELSNGSSGDALLDAALALSAGQVSRAEGLMAEQKQLGGASDALLEMISIVTQDARPMSSAPAGASQFLAHTYRLQAEGDLPAARKAALEATALSPQFGFAWVRLAELEFSFGDRVAMEAAIQQGEKHSPENAQLHVLRGFVEANKRNFPAAEASFTRAKQLDPALGNAWLGLGLVKIAQGQESEGRQYLQNAAALEPNRSLLRSYLAKAFTNEGLWELSVKELARAMELDPADPTPWLYQALDHQAKNQFNAGVSSLEKSIELNDNRQLYRSKFLLDQDRAVRGANLAQIYQQAGLEERARAQAGRAVADDYRSYSAHRFLTNTFNQLRDPQSINQRYEIAWRNELFLSNLLSPVAAGNLSATVTQQEYSSLFASTGGRMAMSGDWLSDGSRELNAQMGYIGAKNSLFVDLQKRDFSEFFGNDDLDFESVSMTYKHDLNERASLFAYVNYEATDQGDLSLPNSPDTDFRLKESAEPVLFAGYTHHWNSSHQTQLLAGRIVHERNIFNGSSGNAAFIGRSNPFLGDPFQDTGGVRVNSVNNDLTFAREAELYQIEGQHLGVWGPLEMVFGARYQTGETKSQAQYTINTSTEGDIERYSLYSYLTGELPLWNTRLTAGLTYDDISFPATANGSFLLDGQDEHNQLGPKLGATAQPLPGWIIRSTYARVMGGYTIDDPFRLEPTQIMGFVHTYRSLIPEDLVGTQPGADMDTLNLSIDGKAGRSIYLGFDYFYGHSEAHTQATAFNQGSLFSPGAPAVISYDQLFDYEEHDFILRADLLAGNHIGLGAHFRYNTAVFNREFPSPYGYNTSPQLTEYNDTQGDMKQIHTYLQYHAATNWFVRAEADYWWQQLDNLSANLTATQNTEESFPYFNLHAGYRLRSSHGEVRLSLYNISNESYNIYPINNFYELPREQTLAVSFRISY